MFEVERKSTHCIIIVIVLIKKKRSKFGKEDVVIRIETNRKRFPSIIDNSKLDKGIHSQLSDIFHLILSVPVLFIFSAFA